MVVCGFEIGPNSDAARRHTRRVRSARASCVSAAIARSALLRIPVSRLQHDPVRAVGRGGCALVGHRFQTDSALRFDVGAGPGRLAPAWRVCRIRVGVSCGLVFLSFLPVEHRQGLCSVISAGTCHAGPRLGT